MDYTKIKSLEHLKDESNGGEYQEFFILLNGGGRSSKRIQWDEEDQIFYITNEIDDTEQELSEDEIMEDSNIGHAINKGAFFKYEYEEAV